jgi:hypothetical protein
MRNSSRSFTRNPSGETVAARAINCLRPKSESPTTQRSLYSCICSPAFRPGRTIAERVICCNPYSGPPP